MIPSLNQYLRICLLVFFCYLLIPNTSYTIPYHTLSHLSCNGPDPRCPPVEWWALNQWSYSNTLDFGDTEEILREIKRSTAREKLDFYEYKCPSMAEIRNSMHDKYAYERTLQ